MNFLHNMNDRKRIIIGTFAITALVALTGGVYLFISPNFGTDSKGTSYADPNIKDVKSANGERLQEITFPDGKKTKVRAGVLMVKITDPNTVRALGMRATPFPGIPGVYEVKTALGKDLLKEKAELEKMPGVAYVEPDYINFPDQVARRIPNDPILEQQEALNDISAPEAWAVNVGSGNTSIAIIDTGVWRSHPDLVNKFYFNSADPVDGVDNDANGYVDDNFGMDFVRGSISDVNGDGIPEWVNDANGADDDNHTGSEGDGHGTGVAGAAAGQSNNSIGGASVNWNTRILPIATGISLTRDDGSSVVGYLDSDVVAGMYYAIARRVNVINLSLGGTCGGSSNCPSQLFRQGMQAALAANVVTVAASGNNSASNGVHSPATIATLAVAATQLGSLTKQPYSNSGQEIDIAAPVPISTTQKGGGYVLMGGTSLATPQVAAAAAYITGLRPGISPDRVRNIMQATANAPGGGRNNDIGAGRLNLYRLIRFCQDC